MIRKPEDADGQKIKVGDFVVSEEFPHLGVGKVLNISSDHLLVKVQFDQEYHTCKIWETRRQL